MAVRALDALLDYQDYPNEAARRSTMRYRPLGIGVIGFGHFLAKNGLRWGESAALEKVGEQMEAMAYYLTQTSIDLAAEFGACQRTRYHDGVFPVDTAKGPVRITRDWESLRARAREVGIRNATLMAAMPSETSSQLANETNGVEPPKSLITAKGNKEVTAVQVVPEYVKLAHAYQLAWDVPLEDYLKTLAVMQQFMDQAMSVNTTYNPALYPQGVSTSALIKDLIFAWKAGTKTLYYCNVLDDVPESTDDSCESGACKI
jgi:ribonucleoside-diphosphate reductase alpha chain